MINMVRLLGFFVIFALFSKAYADEKIIVSAEGQEISEVSISAPNQQNADRCTPVDDDGISSFYCLAIDPENRVLAYAINLLGPNLNLARPIYVRVFPTMESPVRIHLDLSDIVFSKNFEPSSEYYQTWDHYNRVSALNDANAYLVARNYYYALTEVDIASAVVLHEWLRRATHLGEGHSYFAVDTDVLSEINELYNGDLSPIQLSIYKQFGPQIYSSNGFTDYQRLPFADWSLYTILVTQHVAPSAPFDPGLCNIFSYLRNEYESMSSNDRQIVYATWKINQDTLVQDSIKTYLVRCNTSKN